MVLAPTFNGQLRFKSRVADFFCPTSDWDSDRASHLAIYTLIYVSREGFAATFFLIFQIYSQLNFETFVTKFVVSSTFVQKLLNFKVRKVDFLSHQ